jgi:hypothetical protein
MNIGMLCELFMFFFILLVMQCSGEMTLLGLDFGGDKSDRDPIRLATSKGFLLLLFFSLPIEIFPHLLIRLVEETLEPLDPDRRAFRLVGGVLVCHFLRRCNY